eukprot:212667_1
MVDLWVRSEIAVQSSHPTIGIIGVQLTWVNGQIENVNIGSSTPSNAVTYAPTAETLSPTEPTVSPTEPRWTEALVLPNAPNATVPNPVYAKLDVGATEFNRLFHTSDHIIRRGCPRCSYGNHETLYYRRLTNVSSFDVYGSMISWQSKDNTMAVDFNLYSTLGDAINNTNPFTFCNFNGTTSYGGPVGGFRDCGVTAKEDYNWCSADVGVDADRECKYWILNTATDAPTQTPTETTAS